MICMGEENNLVVVGSPLTQWQRGNDEREQSSVHVDIFRLFMLCLVCSVFAILSFLVVNLPDQ